MYCDAIWGEIVVTELVEAAREVEMETFRKREACERVPVEEPWENAGKGPVGVKWVDTNKGEKENPEHRCRLVAKEIKSDKRKDLFAAPPPLEAKTILFLFSASIPATC